MTLRSALTIAAGAVSMLAVTFMSPAFAGCSDRPGTPTDIAIDAREGALNIRWRDTTRPGEGSCHDIEIKRTANGDTSKSVVGGVCLSGGTTGSFLLNNIGYNQAYCVRLKARDHAGTQGCVSQNWSASVCGSSLNPPFPTGGPAPAATSEFEPGTNRGGSDYTHHPLASAQPTLCQNECKGDSKCAAWTYVKPNIQGPQAVCWLKSTVAAASKNDCCTSGVPDRFIPPEIVRRFQLPHLILVNPGPASGMRPG